MEASEIQWNEPARAKILDDADGVLREAVLDVAKTSGIASDDAFAELNARLKDRFIDYEPGPDIRKYADAIAAGEFSGGDAEGGSGASDSSTGDSSTGDDASEEPVASADTPNEHHRDNAAPDDGPPTDAFSDEVSADAAEAGGQPA